MPPLLPEHRSEDRRVGLEVRSHHDDVFWHERRVLLESALHGLVDNLRFSHRAGARMEGNRRIRKAPNGPLSWRRWAPKLEDVGLQRAQQVRSLRRLIGLALAAQVLIDREQDLLEVMAQSSEVRKKRMSIGRSLPLRRKEHVRQVFLGGLEHIERRRNRVREGVEELKEQGRNGLERKHLQAFKAQLAGVEAVSERGQRLSNAGGEVVRPQRMRDAMPELGLPTRGGALRPFGQHLRSIHDVVVVYRREARREAKQAIGVGLGSQIRKQLFGRRVLEHARDRPLEAVRGVRRRLLGPSDRPFEHRFDHCPRERKRRISPNAQPLCEREGQPTLHAAAMNDDHLVFERTEGLLANQRCERVCEVLGSVAADELHALSEL